MVFPSGQIGWNSTTLLVYGHATPLCRKQDSRSNISAFMSDFRYILTPATAASKPLDRLDRGPPRHGIAVYGAASLPTSFSRDSVSAVVVAAALVRPAPATATPDELVPVQLKPS